MKEKVEIPNTIKDNSDKNCERLLSRNMVTGLETLVGQIVINKPPLIHYPKSRKDLIPRLRNKEEAPYQHPKRKLDKRHPKKPHINIPYGKQLPSSLRHNRIE